MATTYKSSKVADGVQPRVGLDLISAFAEYDLTAALVVNDVIEMVKVPAGATILMVNITSDDLDTGGSPAILLHVGDGDTAARFISGTNIAQAGGSQRLTEKAGLNYTYTAEDTIDVKVGTAPTTGATSGKIRLNVIYTMQS